MRDVQPGEHRGTEIPGQHAAQPSEVLDVKRLVEAELGTELVDHRLRRFRRKQDIERIPRDQMNQPESHDRDAKQDQHGVTQSERYEASHGKVGCKRYAIAPRAEPLSLTA